jgi:nitrite reductase (NADH) large subunit
MKEKLVVVGNGMVGWKLLQKLHEMGAMENFHVITFCEEPRPAYDRVHLSEFFGQKTAEELSLAPKDWYQEIGVELIIGDAITSIDRDNKTVLSKLGKKISYNKLILSTGSSAFIPPVPGIDAEGIFPYRTIEDLEDMMAYGKTCKSAVVIGGGLLGLEAAKALVDMGLEAHVIEFAPRLMPRQIDDKGSSMLQARIEELGVKIHLNKATKNINVDGKTKTMEFSDGSSLSVDMICVSAGIRPRDELAKASGIEVGPRGGILVNDQLLTSDPDIYAIGECALHGDMIYGLVAPGYRMAEAVASQLTGKEGAFAGMDMSTKLKLMGVDVGSIGDPFVEGEHVKHIEVSNGATNTYKKLVIDNKSGTLLGAILVGDAEAYGTLMGLYNSAKSVPEDAEAIISPAGDDSVGGADAMDDSASICSCENVTKGQIVAAIADGNKTIDGIKSCTKAGTGCGSCLTLVKDVLDSEMEKAGESVDKSICEHFPYTRVELEQIIRGKNITTYKELLHSHGKGHGCEVCKPAVASILASTFNAPILDQPHLQDTNDAFLANIQKNGTYSIVPRVPGGEITPDQLIAIGQVAKDYDLYTKITGGQRIDLFGARLEQLLPIWEKLIAAGLETGHAYAKSLRTVKSCVGSTWCRYGVQDSTTMAILLENRYKGLRSPHKIKMAVSGCARECAEAQGKDIGVIATEKGWNLYVCGNGGMKPQHAVLFGEDLNNFDLIKTIDRVLMYYCRTADRLTRTATWLNKLPGGLKHLKEVVYEDSLNLCDEFDKAMQHIVDTYECEWKNAVEDPQKRQRFSHFINSGLGDPTVQFNRLRDQITPNITKVDDLAEIDS